jgi:hypothetical protein
VTIVHTNRSHWAYLYRQRQPRDPFPVSTGPDVLAEWVRAIYIPTPGDRMLKVGLDKAIKRSMGTDRFWVALDGPAHIGKSELALKLAIERAGWTPGHTKEERRHGYLQVPTVYVEAGSAQQGAGLYASICHALGEPSTGGEQVSSARLLELLPAHGTTAVIVDDAHFYRRSSRAERLTHSLRATLRLPVTFIYVGAGLRNSALLKRSPHGDDESTEQMRRRCVDVPISPLVLPADGRRLNVMLSNYMKRISSHLPGFEFPGFTNATVKELHHRLEGHPGGILAALKEATVRAVEDGERQLTTDGLIGELPAGPGDPMTVTEAMASSHR